MSANVEKQTYSKRTIKQVQMDCMRALCRAGYCPENSDVYQIRCMDHLPESETEYGNQLWYFEGFGVDEFDGRQRVHGVVEYSVQFGLHEVIEDGVFDSEHQRERFRLLYDRVAHSVNWWHPGHRLLAAGLLLVASIWVAFLVVRSWLV